MALLDTEGLVGFLVVMLWAWGLIDVIATDADLCRHVDKAAWVILVLIVPAVGALIWIFLGRPLGAGIMPGGRATSKPDGATAPAPRPTGTRGARTWRSRYRTSGPFGPFGPDSAARYLGEFPISDRRSERLDAVLDDELARRRLERRDND
ncbi:MAG TPA: PLD nuclease N-terminal domain-containing protein [Acidimicrobiia bacterium]|jgi:hypothetical protein